MRYSFIQQTEKKVQDRFEYELLRSGLKTQFDRCFLDINFKL